MLLGPTGVVLGSAVRRDVGDPVVEEHEHLGAVVDAQPVTGAEILIDPHPHELLLDDDATE